MPRANRHLELWPRERLLRDLNDRLGHARHQAAVFLERDDQEVDVLKAEGELGLRREDVPLEEHLSREDDG